MNKIKIALLTSMIGLSITPLLTLAADSTQLTSAQYRTLYNTLHNQPNAPQDDYSIEGYKSCLKYSCCSYLFNDEPEKIQPCNQAFYKAMMTQQVTNNLNTTDSSLSATNNDADNTNVDTKPAPPQATQQSNNNANAQTSENSSNYTAPLTNNSRSSDKKTTLPKKQSPTKQNNIWF